MNATSGTTAAAKFSTFSLSLVGNSGAEYNLHNARQMMKPHTSRFSNTLALTAPGALLLASPVAEAGDIFLKIAGIPGESRDMFYKDQIEVLSWSWGVSQQRTGPSAGGTVAPGKVSLQDLSFTRRVDKASPALFLRCATGEMIPQVTFMFPHPEVPSQSYYVVTLHDVTVTSIQGERPQPADGVSGGIVTERVSLNFTKIEMSYRPFNPSTGTLGEAVSATAEVEPATTAQ
jgi:type VI secretion system secreted protein Hcp